jgi:hypothetical protein
MRRLLFVAVALVAIFGLVAPASAQAPAPKVTITGLIDQIGTYSHNMSIYDADYNRAKDDMAYGRTRGRFDVIGEIGKAKAVLGLEIDAYWGQTGAADSGLLGGPQGSGATGGWDLNTDTIGQIEVKWLYTEFALPIPLDSTMRLGAQPFGTLATYKLAAYANGDFPGVALNLNFSPAARLNLAYVQVEEALTGARDGFVRGEDWAIIASFDFSPFKGLDIKPMYSFFQAKGVTAGAARQGRGGVSTTAAFTNATNPAGNRTTENRHTLGVDARWTAGPFSLQPTLLYQFGDRSNIITLPAYGTVGSITKADIDAWFADVRGAFNVGPLTLSVMAMWTTGDKADSNPFTEIGYYQPLDTDTGYAADWGTQIYSLGIDYFQILYSTIPGLNPGVAIGYDKYGRRQVGAKVAYAFTPAFTVGAAGTAAWTDEKVDNDSTLAAATGLTPTAGLGARGDSRYLGTEVNVSSTYRFTPGIAFDIAGGYLFACEALVHRPFGSRSGVNDVYTGTARVRYAF